jgi:hypothetical protein
MFFMNGITPGTHIDFLIMNILELHLPIDIITAVFFNKVSNWIVFLIRKDVRVLEDFLNL